MRNQVIVVSTKNEAYRQGDAILQLIDKQVAGVAIVRELQGLYWMVLNEVSRGSSRAGDNLSSLLDRGYRTPRHFREG